MRRSGLPACHWYRAPSAGWVAITPGSSKLALKPPKVRLAFRVHVRCAFGRGARSTSSLTATLVHPTGYADPDFPANKLHIARNPIDKDVVFVDA